LCFDDLFAVFGLGLELLGWRNGLCWRCHRVGRDVGRSSKIKAG
jgi:hypothetical protein